MSTPMEPAGEALDKRVAERVLGWQWVTNYQGHSGWASNGPDAPLVTHGETWGGFWAYPLTPRFSTEQDAAWSLAERLHAAGYGVRIVTWPDVTQVATIRREGANDYAATANDYAATANDYAATANDYAATANAVAATLPHALCLLALAVLGREG